MWSAGREKYPVSFLNFPLLLKEGWPDYFLVMIQMLIPAGVVDS